MLYLYKDNDFVFYHMYKCGGTSIVTMLLNVKRQSVQIGDINRPINECVRKGELDDYSLYVNIRNPYDRIVSMYKFVSQWATKPPSFKNFFYDSYLENSEEEWWLNSQQKSLFVDGKLPENIFMVKLEEADRYWPVIMKRHFDVDIQYVPKFNATIHGEAMSYFDDGMIEEVKRKEVWAIEQYCLY